VASSTITGRNLLLFFQRFPMATDALPMIGLLKVEPGRRSVAEGTEDLFISLYQGAFIQHILPVFIKMMAIRAGYSLFDMEVMRERDGRAFFPRLTSR
jgi:hypothetical protein